jgi:threonine synthase
VTVTTLPLYSTNNQENKASWRDAVLRGLAPDGGLYLPLHYPHLSQTDIQSLKNFSFSDLSALLSTRFIGSEVPEDIIKKICRDAFNFPLVLRKLTPSLAALELFHGPTCAFKDFGARFMARLFRYFWGDKSQQLTVLVATSGDTGSAVANAFFDQSPNPPIRVVILYPKNKVSDVQRRQMTTLGYNVTALQVRGTFDDCQRLVKEALNDQKLLESTALTSANSINIARLLPQAFYYAFASLMFEESNRPIFSVPSGNLGNLTGGLIANQIGFNSAGFIAACNSNNAFPKFLGSGHFTPKASVDTISNAMDVGNPSNFHRITRFTPKGYGTSDQQPLIRAYSISDQDTLDAINRYKTLYGYTLDPHTAVGAVALERFAESSRTTNSHQVLVATAHPGKFASVVKQALGSEPETPESLKAVLNQPEKFTEVNNSYDELFKILAVSSRSLR